MILTKDNKGRFLNPWKTIRAFPKIIDMDENGNMVTRVAFADDFISMKTVTDSIKEPNAPNSNAFRFKNRSQRNNIFDIMQNASGGEFTVKPIKTKILLQCSEDICRFLACPNIKEFCVMCAVPRPHSTNNYENKLTTCKKVPSRSVIYQRTFWIPGTQRSQRVGDIGK